MALYTLRPFRPADAASMARHGNNPAIFSFMTDGFPNPYTEERATAFIEMAMGHSPTRLMGIEVNGEIAGGIGLHPLADIQRLNAELGYWLSQEHWGRGIMTQVVRDMVRYGFTHLEVTRIFARPFGNNPASARVLEKAGFVLEGRFAGTILKNGELLDELVYAVRK